MIDITKGDNFMTSSLLVLYTKKRTRGVLKIERIALGYTPVDILD